MWFEVFAGNCRIIIAVYDSHEAALRLFSILYKAHNMHDSSFGESRNAKCCHVFCFKKVVGKGEKATNPMD